MSEYLELLEDAFDALEALLDKTHHGKGGAFRVAYLALEQSINEHRNRDAAPVPEQARAHAVCAQRWKRLPMGERDRQVLTILTEHRLTIGELVDHVRERNPDIDDIYPSNLSSVVTRLYRARELDRTGEHYAGGGPRVRYRYFKRTELDGPIADLDRTFYSDRDVA